MPIGRPAITDQDPVEVRARHRGGLGEAAARLNPIDRRVGRRKSPEPLQVPADFPARFIGAHHRAAAHLRTQGVVRGSGLPRGAMYGMHQPTPRDGEAVPLLQERHDFAERQSELFVEHDDQRDHLRAELRGGRADRVRRLQGMPRLDAMAASIAAADVDVKLADHHARDRQLFLILVDDTGLHHRPGTVGTMRGERRVVALIHARGTSPTRLGSIRTAGLPPWSLRMRLQRFRKWGRLPEAGSPRLVHLSFQMIDLLAQPIVLSLEAIMLALRLVALALGAFRPFSQVFDLTSGPIVQGWVA